MDLNELFVFARVVQAGSFVRAARDLGMPKSTVSRRVFELETRLGARLLERTTRSLRLTEVGREYFARAERIVADAEEAEAAVVELQAEPRGSLRVAAPQNFGQLGAIGHAFVERHPRVRLEIVCSDRVVDLVAEGFDLAVRVGRLADSTLIARTLGTIRNVLVASPRLFAAEPLPASPAQLTSLPCIAFGSAAERARWELSGENGESCMLRIEPRFVANDFEVLAAAARSGLGVALLPEQRCSEMLRAGTLRRVLPEWSSIVRTVHAVYPSSRHLSPKVTAFVQHLAVAFASAPWLGG